MEKKEREEKGREIKGGGEGEEKGSEGRKRGGGWGGDEGQLCPGWSGPPSRYVKPWSRTDPPTPRTRTTPRRSPSERHQDTSSTS